MNWKKFRPDWAFLGYQLIFIGLCFLAGDMYRKNQTGGWFGPVVAAALVTWFFMSRQIWKDRRR